MRGVALLLALALPACTTVAEPRAATSAPAPAPTPRVAPAELAQRASRAIDGLVRLNQVAQRAVAIVLPFLSPQRARLVELAAARVDEAIAIVAEARDAGELVAAIAAARETIADYKRVAGA